MKRIITIFLWLIIFAIIGILIYIFLIPQKQLRPLSVIPKDAIFIVEAPDPFGLYKRIHNYPIWKHLIQHPYFRQYDTYLKTLENLLEKNTFLAKLLKNKALWISIHRTQPRDWDLLYVMALNKQTRLITLSKIFATLGEKFGFKVHQHDYRDKEIIELEDVESGEILYLTIHNNLLIFSYTASLVHKAIDASRQPYFVAHPVFSKQIESMKSGDIRLYVHGDYLDDFLAIYSSASVEELKAIPEVLDVIALYFTIEPKAIKGEGNLFPKVESASYLNALLEERAVASEALEVLPQQTALFLQLSFEDFKAVRDRLMTLWRSKSPEEYEAFEKQRKRLERLLNIRLDEILFDWVGNTIAFALVEPPSSATGTMAERIVVFHAKDKALAQERLELLMRQMKRRTPFKPFEATYKDVVIHQWKLKGLFKILLGKWLKDIQMPYVAQYKDYVLFAMDLATLKTWIDALQEGNALSNADFLSQLPLIDEAANYTIFYHSLPMWALIRRYTNYETFDELRRNRDYFLDLRYFVLKAYSEEQYYTMEFALQLP